MSEKTSRIKLIGFTFILTLILTGMTTAYLFIPYENVTIGPKIAFVKGVGYEYVAHIHWTVTTVIANHAGYRNQIAETTERMGITQYDADELIQGIIDWNVVEIHFYGNFTVDQTIVIETDYFWFDGGNFTVLGVPFLRVDADNVMITGIVVRAIE